MFPLALPGKEDNKKLHTKCYFSSPILSEPWAAMLWTCKALCGSVTAEMTSGASRLLAKMPHGAACVPGNYDNVGKLVAGRGGLKAFWIVQGVGQEQVLGDES